LHLKKIWMFIFESRAIKAPNDAEDLQVSKFRCLALRGAIHATVVAHFIHQYLWRQN
jgi:hypothetical protein